MQKKKLIFSVMFASALAVGACVGLSLKDRKAAPLNVKAAGEPNNMFGYIYSDAFNNQNNHLTLFVFEGTSTGLTEDYAITDTSKVKVNNVSLSTLGGTISVWKNNNWVQITYPTSSVFDGATLEIESGITAGDAIFSGAKFTMDSTLKWSFAGFNDAVTATYRQIPYAAYNTNAQLLIQYTGSGNLGGDKITNHHDIYNYDNYLTIDGNPFSALSGAEIRTWGSEQPWLWLRFPAVSAGAVLKIESGMRFYSQVFESMSFVFDGSAWVKSTLVEDDPLVANSDYTLFTPSDFNLQGNDTNPFYGDVGSALLDSFGFQLKLTVPSGEAANMVTYIKFCTTNIYGSSPIFDLTLDHDNNVYAKFNGAIDWSTSKVTAWTEDVSHLVEFYAIRTSSTTVSYLFGLDKVVIFKVNNADISSIDFTGHTFVFVNNGGTYKSKACFDSCSETTTTALNRFGVNKLSSKDVPFTSHADTGACLTKYAQAKAFYNTYLTGTQKIAFASEVAYANLRERFATWAEKNGETITFNTTNGALVSSRISTFNPIMVEENKAIYFAIIVASIATIAAFGLLVVARKKRNNQ